MAEAQGEENVRAELDKARTEIDWLKRKIRRKAERRRSTPKAQQLHIDTLTAENKNLKTEVEKLKRVISAKEQGENDSKQDKEIEELNAKNESLKKEISRLEQINSQMDMQQQRRSKENKTLKEKYKKLQQECKKMAIILKEKGHEITILGEKMAPTTMTAEFSHLNIQDDMLLTDLDDKTFQESAMTQDHKDALTRHWVEIIENLDTAMIIDHLIQKRVLNGQMRDEILAKETKRDKTRELLTILPTRGDSAFKHFEEALEKDYQYLADLLKLPKPVYV